MEWNYGDAYKRYPIESGTAVFADGSKLKCHDIFKPLPSFMKEADLIFVDAPWNKGNLTSFYTKAGIKPSVQSYEAFYKRLFKCIDQINSETAYCEIGKEYLTDFVMQMKNLYPHVTIYNSTYYHNKSNLCYIIRGSGKRKKLPLDGMDEEDIIKWICENEDYHCIADLCMGRGLVAVNAAKNGKRFLGTELNHKRLSVALESLSKIGFEYRIEGASKTYNEKQKHWTTQYLKTLKEIRFRVKPEEYERFKKAAEAGEYRSMRAFFIDAINEKIKKLEESKKMNKTEAWHGMEYLMNTLHPEAYFMLLDEAKEYYANDKNISQDFVGNKAGYIKEVSEAASLKELAEVLNHYLFKAGNKFYVTTI